MNLDKYLKELFELLSIPSISAQSEHKKDILTACNWLEKKLKILNFDAKILETAGYPVVYAENLKAGQDKPTVLIYGHYDVQDAGNRSEWTSDPFKPEIRSNNIYARGAADDKGQLFTWISATENLLIARKTLPVNVKFIIEGEEEVGSLNLDEFVEQNQSLLQADICAISDTHCLNEEQPLIDYGLRGIVYTEVNVKTLGKDVHSGLYGGNILNPVNIIAGIISKLKDDRHKILIPGFFKNVRKLSAKERKELEKSPLSAKDIVEETGAEIVTGEAAYSIPERAGARPTLDVNGIWGGYQGEGPKTIIPSEAGAKISIRTVPYQTASEIYTKFESFVQQITPKGVELSIKLLTSAEPILFDTKSTYFKAAEKAYGEIFGNKPIYELSGGTIGACATFKNILGVDCILMGYGLPDDALHGPNEKLSLSMFEKGIRTNIEFLKGL